MLLPRPNATTLTSYPDAAPVTTQAARPDAATPALTGILDTHFHSDNLSEKGLDPVSELNQAFSEGFEGGLDIGCTSDDLPRRYNLLKAFPKLCLAGAMGPWELDEPTKGSNSKDSNTKDANSKDSNSKDSLSYEEINSRLQTLKQNLLTYHAKVLGEIGLDYYWNYGTVDKQIYLFEAQLKLAAELKLPVAIHERMSQTDTIATISRLTPPKAGIIHCFDGYLPLMEKALDLGYYISFAGNLTYKKNQDLREALTRVPLDRLLFETDAPYLTPVPHRGKPNTPRYVVHTYQCAAQVLNLPLEVLATQVRQNFAALLSR